jgi:hypothetical protein
MSFSGFCSSAVMDTEVKVFGLGSFQDNGNSMCADNRAPTDTDGSVVVGDGTISYLYIYNDVPATTNTALIAKVYVNGQPSNPLISCTLTTGNKKCSDMTNSVPVKDGDLVSVTLIKSSTDPTLADIRVMLGKQ